MIENRGIQLGSLCTAHKEESLRITQAVRNFIEQYEHVIKPQLIIKQLILYYLFFVLVAIVAA